MAKKNETEATTTTMASMFVLPAGLDLGKAERMNLPMNIKHKDVPVGGVLVGELIKVIDSPVTTTKGMLLWLRLSGGNEVTFACTGAVRQALAPGVKVDDDKALQSALLKHVGKVIICKRLAETGGSKYDRNNYRFDVFVTADKKVLTPAAPTS